MENIIDPTSDVAIPQKIIFRAAVFSETSGDI
jgi:hypothetical protein